MSRVIALNHVSISVADMDRALAFWNGALGLRLLGRGTAEYAHLDVIVGLQGTIIEWAELEVPGGSMVELFRYHRPSAKPIAAAVNNPGATHICLEVDDVDAVLAAVRSAGYDSVSPAAVEIPFGGWVGYRDVYVRDPDGVVVEFTQRPG